MMQKRKIPPQPGIPFKLNHNFPKLEPLHVQIAGLSGKTMALKPSPAATDGKIKCIVNSFDASGGNTSLVVEEAPEPSMKTELSLPCYVIGISAKTITSLKENRRRLLDYLMRYPDTNIADLAYTTAARRVHEVLRVAYSAKSTREITNILRKEVHAETSDDPRTKPSPMKVVFAFTGQGSQYAGMGKHIYQYSSAFRDLLHTYEQMVCHQDLPSFIHLIADEKSDINAASVVCVQLAIVALEIAMSQLLKTWGIFPDIVMGHSLGEYSALCVAGVLSVSDTLFLVGKRAQLMENKLLHGEYSMLAISKGLEDVRQLLLAESGRAWSNTEIACINAPQVTVVSGPAREFDELRIILEEEGVRATVLKVPYGFHSRHVEPVLDELGVIASGLTFSAPIIPVASTLLGEIVPAGKSEVFSPSYLSRQARERVNFVGATEACKSAGFVKLQTYWVEIGPEPVCTGLLRRILEVPAIRLLPIIKSKEDNWITMSSCFATLYSAGASINWPQCYKEYKNSLRLVDLPTYAFDVKDFWTPYVEHTTVASTVSDIALQKGSNALALPKFSTTSLQLVEEESLKKEKVSVRFSSHTSESSLYKAIQGHRVNGLAVCSLSIFCDMAKSAAQYAYQKLNPAKKVPMMSVFNVDMTHALVVPELDPGLRVITKVSYPSAGNKAIVTFQSTNLELSTEHGSCEVVFEDSSTWFSQLSQTSFLVNSRIESLKDMSSIGKAHRLLKPVIYKLFDNLVTYGKDYHGMEEVWIDAEGHDAVGIVNLTNTTGSGNFLYNPFWIDAVIHLAGFLLNSGLKYPEDIACLSTGFESWRILEELQPDGMYTTYVSMQEETSNTLSGSAYVYNHNHKLVQVTTGIKFMKLKKVILNSVLRPGMSSSIGVNKAMVKFEGIDSRSTRSRGPDTGNTTPETHSRDNSSDEKEPMSHGAVTPASSISESGEANLLDAFLAIVASESAFNIEDMGDSTAFADMGIDSLMSITILAVVRRDTGVDLPAIFFIDNSTVGDAKAALLGAKNPEKVSELIVGVEKARETSVKPAIPVSQEPIQQHVSKTEQERPMPQLSSPTVAVPATIAPATAGPTKAAEIGRESKVILLQGSPSSTGSKVFLLPDGSGSPSRYIQLPALSLDANVYGLESPFLKVPMEYKCGLKGICDSFFAAIKSVQPTGHYVLAGYSLGAIYAYEVAQKLLNNGEQVDSLILIDMAVPKEIKGNLSPTEEQLKDAGIISSTSRQTNAQKAHIAKTV